MNIADAENQAFQEGYNDPLYGQLARFNPRQTRDFELMRTPKAWSCKTLIYIKRYRQAPIGSHLDTGRIEESEGLFAFIPDNGVYEESEKGGMHMLARLIEEGWMVD